MARSPSMGDRCVKLSQAGVAGLVAVTVTLRSSWPWISRSALPSTQADLPAG